MRKILINQIAIQIFTNDSVLRVQSVCHNISLAKICEEPTMLFFLLTEDVGTFRGLITVLLYVILSVRLKGKLPTPPADVRF